MTVFAKAASLGFCYIRGMGRCFGRIPVWCCRFTKNADGSGPAIFVGFDPAKWAFIVKEEVQHDTR
jgi:hypothetical protein